MTPELVESLLVVVNTPEVWKAMEGYAKSRIETAHKELASVQDMRKLGELQGKVTEMNQLLGLRDRIRAEAQRIVEERLPNG